MMHKYSKEKIQFQSSQSLPLSVSVVGARGYTGLELARILLHHPAVQLTHCFATQKFSLSSLIGNPKAAQVQCLPDSEIESNLTDLVFLATPAEISQELAPKILQAGKKVIDLSGAFRLKENDYQKWYGFEHRNPGLLTKAHYGLLPFSGPGTAQLIANPGCYATAVSMALIPLLKANLIEASSIVIDAKSGTSGGGKKPSENLLFSEVEGDCLPYKIGKHQHLPEIIETVKTFSGVAIDPHFTTSLLPIRRGIIASVFARMKTQASTEASLQEIEKAFAQAYAGNPLIQFGSVVQRPELLSLKKVVGTPMTHLTYEVVENKIYVFSLIDNLLKGAASQAVENLNCLLDLPPSTGLEYLEAIT